MEKSGENKKKRPYKRTPETPGVPQTGDDHWKPILLFVLLGASAAGLMATMIYKKKRGKTEKAE